MCFGDWRRLVAGDWLLVTGDWLLVAGRVPSRTRRSLGCELSLQGSMEAAEQASDFSELLIQRVGLRTGEEAQTRGELGARFDLAMRAERDADMMCKNLRLAPAVALGHIRGYGHTGASKLTREPVSLSVRKGTVRNFVCEAGWRLSFGSFPPETRMRVGAVGNRVLCGFPRSGGRVLCVHGSGSVHALVHFTWMTAKSDLRTESRIGSLRRASSATSAPICR